MGNSREKELDSFFANLIYVNPFSDVKLQY